MEISLSSLEETSIDRVIDAHELNYEQEGNYFWMRIVMGDDWFQKVRSSFTFEPRVVRIRQGVAFVVFDKTKQLDEFADWVEKANKAVDEGFRTMKG